MGSTQRNINLNKFYPKKITFSENHIENYIKNSSGGDFCNGSKSKRKKKRK